MEIGTGADASRWISSSSLGDDAKMGLLEFVGKFSFLSFTREDDVTLDELERKDDVRLPAWLRETRRTLAFVDLPAQFRLHSYDDWTPREDREKPIWYTMELGYSNFQERASLLGADMYPIALWIETAHSYLGVRMRESTDRRIYEFAAEDVVDDTRNALPPDSSIFPVYNSYSAMLGRIVELRLPDDTLIAAQ